MGPLHALLSALLLVAACSSPAPELVEGETGMPGECDKCDGGWADPETDLPTLPVSTPANEFSADFVSFLDAAYGEFAFDASAGFGGWPPGADTTLTHNPVVFVHGNGDEAVGGAFGGWSTSITGFRASGYAEGELYALTWGPGDVGEVSLQYHSRTHLERVRAFLLAVLEYTGAERIDVIGHSMGVTLARKAILGGAGSDALAGGAYELGPSIASHIDSFVGIAGANLGLAACWYTGPTTPTCGATNGLYPGRLFWGQVVGRSAFLDELNERTDPLAAEVYSVWSPDDNIIGFGGIVWGAYTAQIPGQTGEVRFDDLGHFALRDEWQTQLSLVE